MLPRLSLPIIDHHWTEPLPLISLLVHVDGAFAPWPVWIAS